MKQMSKQPKPSKQQVEGEGSYSATRSYNQHLTEWLSKGKVDQAAKRARRAVETAGDELLEAERQGKAPAKIPSPTKKTSMKKRPSRGAIGSSSASARPRRKAARSTTARGTSSRSTAAKSTSAPNTASRSASSASKALPKAGQAGPVRPSGKIGSAKRASARGSSMPNIERSSKLGTMKRTRQTQRGMTRSRAAR